MLQEKSRNQIIRVNGKVTEVANSNTLAFGGFISTLGDELEKQSQIITTIEINGQEITEADQAILQSKPLTEVGQIDVFSKSPVDLAYETLDTLDVYLERVIATIKMAAKEYAKEENEQNLELADDVFAKAVDSLDLFIKTIGGIKLALRIGLNPKIALVEASLLSIMNDILEAKRTGDTTDVAELLEKDLIQNMVEWKQDAFPTMRNWMNA